MIKKIIIALKPPPKWQKIAIIVCGMFVGLVIHTLYVSNAASYMSNDPKTCLNCHVMAPQYATWQHSSHREVATCNECHVPQDNMLRTYLFKATDGLRHSALFTLRGKEQKQTVQIQEAGEAVVQANCIRCHSKRNEFTTLNTQDFDAVKHGNGRFCWDCHREVPHGSVRSLSATPKAYVPLLDSPIPEWLKNKEKGEASNATQK